MNPEPSAGELPAVGQEAPERPAGLPAFGVAALAAALPLAALAVGERAGLPGVLAWTIGFCLIAVSGASAVWLARTAAEREFLGRALILGPIPGGLILGALSGSAVFHIIRPTLSQDLAATILGSAAGLVAAYVLARVKRGSRLLIGEAPSGEDGVPSLVIGLLIAAAGALLVWSALPPARDAAALITGWGPGMSLTAVLAAPTLAIAVGGLRGLAALAAALALMIAAALALSLWLGLSQLGGLPLPGFSQAETLLGIAGARTRLFQSDALPFMAGFLPPEGWRGLIFSGAFLGSALIAALIGRAVTPGVALADGGVATAAAGQAGLLFGLAAMAGYAVEAAGLQFVGASLQTPPPGLLEAARQGLAEFCGARPETLDQLRAACGLAPRAQGQLAITQIRLAEPFLWTGTPVALGAPSALAAPARLGAAAFPLLAITAGLWLTALGLGRSVFGRGKIAPGLASQRLARVRMAAVGAAVILGFAAARAPLPDTVWATAAMLAALALGLDALQRRPGGETTGPAVQRPAASRRSEAPRTTAQSA
jgi:hypothetical protein